MTPAQRLQSILEFAGCPGDLEVREVNGTRPADVSPDWKWYARSQRDPEVLVGSSLTVVEATLQPFTLQRHGRIVEVT